jgi:predicted NBD/HSP70 family sugar kinase
LAVDFWSECIRIGRVSGNERRLLDLMRLRGSVSIATAAESTGLSRPTVADLVGGLRRKGVAVSVEPLRAGARVIGRPPQRFGINPRLGVAVGVEFERGHVRAAVSDLSLTVLGERLRSLPVAEDFDAAMDAAAGLVEELLAAAGADRSRVVGMVASVPAPVDRAAGTVHAATVLPTWAGRRPAEALRRRLDVVVEAGNDACLGAIAEATLGAAQGRRHVVYVKISAGVGCGLVLDGQPFQGALGTAGELGHVIVDEQGPVCYCGNRGCLRTYVDAEAITEALRLTPHAERLFRAGRRTPEERLAMVVESAVDGDPACERVIREAAHRLGIALANVCNLLNPECVVVGGTLARAGELVLGPLRAATQGHTVPLAPGAVEVLPGRLQERAEVHGALAQVLRGANERFRDRLYWLAGASVS